MTRPLASVVGVAVRSVTPPAPVTVTEIGFPRRRTGLFDGAVSSSRRNPRGACSDTSTVSVGPATEAITASGAAVTSNGSLDSVQPSPTTWKR